ncbi:MAG: thioredoxin family protein, partial [Alphaproteobacteria bacterium]
MALFGKKNKEEKTTSCCCGGNCDAESMAKAET